MTDREEREEHIKRLEAALACEEKQFLGKCSKQTCDDNCALLYEQGNWGEWKETLRYAINSLKTDLKYDLLYEETSGQADKSTTKNNLGVDYISRKAVQTRLKEIINEMETIFADIREREVNDSVCGLCEYDCDHGLDGYANECPGFEKDDCFKLNEKYKAEWLDISNLPSVTPQEPRTGHWIAYEVRLPDRTILNYRCSVCGRKLIGYSTETLSEAPYCHCGARMVEPQKSEDKE